MISFIKIHSGDNVDVINGFTDRRTGSCTDKRTPGRPDCLMPSTPMGDVGIQTLQPRPNQFSVGKQDVIILGYRIGHRVANQSQR